MEGAPSQDHGFIHFMMAAPIEIQEVQNRQYMAEMLSAANPKASETLGIEKTAEECQGTGTPRGPCLA